MDLNDPKGFLENLFAFHSQYLKEHGTEPFSEGELKDTLMDFFIAGTVRHFYYLRQLDIYFYLYIMKMNNLFPKFRIRNCPSG